MKSKIKCGEKVHEDIATKAYHKGYYEGLQSLKMTLGEDMFTHAVKTGAKEERAKVVHLLNKYSVTAPKKSYTATFTPKQFLSVLDELI